MPALTNAPGAVTLEDTRTICARDAQTVVLDETQANEVFQSVRNDLAHQFSRFISFSQADITFSLMDRLHIEEMFKVVGRDFSCPDIRGLTHFNTNGATRELAVSVLSALPLGTFRAVCAHEITHIWIEDNVPATRKKALSPQAIEGLCELMAFLCVDAAQDESAKHEILANAYTRGQIHAFIAAEKQFGMNDILDWMRRGSDDRLKADEPYRVRTLDPVALRASSPPVVFATAPIAPAPKRTYNCLTLKAILWDTRHPSAIVNDASFFPGDTAQVQLSGTNTPVRCLEIQKDSVRLKLLNGGEEQTLKLEPPTF